MLDFIDVKKAIGRFILYINRDFCAYAIAFIGFVKRGESNYDIYS
jgi:hypothetical protein